MFEKLRLNRAWRAELRELDQKKAPAHLAKPDDSSPGQPTEAGQHQKGRGRAGAGE